MTKPLVRLHAKEKDLGGFRVRRMLPQIARRAVGPFVFFDHMGPSVLEGGMDVRPHPHIGLATVTYLFEGVIEHRDSLGNECLIEPGAVNFMVAGKGIVHSERTPDPVRGQPARLHGLQLWVALPEADEEIAPSFKHHAPETLPEIDLGGVRGRLLLGQGFGLRSPVAVHSPLLYAEFFLEPGQRLDASHQAEELALYVISGNVRVNVLEAPPFEMVVFGRDNEIRIEASTQAHFVVLGGSSLGPRFIEWNFVTSRVERLNDAKALWAHGPAPDNPRFRPVPGDSEEYIRLKI